MQKHYLTLGILVIFLMIAAGWFVWTPSPKEPPVAGTPGVMPPPSSRGGRAPVSFSASPFLATHEQRATFIPDGENVAPSFHVEMEGLKERLDAAPQDTTTLIRMARLKQDGHQTEEAVDYYRRYLALHPEGRQAWLDLALGYGTLGRWPDALEAAQAMLDHFPDDPAGLYNLGAIYANTGRFAEARAAWERAAEQDRHPEMKARADDALQRLAALHP